jgi:MoaA/NifB/PqqE/SkfB family radical SAM enzyme
MLAGAMLPDHCSSCYKLEKIGILSARQQETVEWANRLNLQTTGDLDKIESPAYYEVRPSNVCNLKCRMCSPENSNLIEEEYKRLKLIPNDQRKIEYKNFDLVNFTNLKKLYVAGGEPTVSVDFYKFLDKCIQEKNTDFEFTVNTNGTKFSSKFKQQLSHFSKFGFIFSIDGYTDLNYYIRFPSDWNTIIDNAYWVMKNGHGLAFNITVSIYNVSNFYNLVEFLEREFPKTIIHCQLAETNNDVVSALNYPNSKAVLDNLLKIKTLKFYNNNFLFNSFIDGLIDQYNKKDLVPIEQMRQFFTFNDLLDASRSVKLVDYLPELDSFRNEI